MPPSVRGASQFLVYEIDLGELLLNAVALEFVLMVDEMIYAAYVPKVCERRVPAELARPPWISPTARRPLKPHHAIAPCQFCRTGRRAACPCIRVQRLRYVLENTVPMPSKPMKTWGGVDGLALLTLVTALSGRMVVVGRRDSSRTPVRTPPSVGDRVLNDGPRVDSA